MRREDQSNPNVWDVCGRAVGVGWEHVTHFRIFRQRKRMGAQSVQRNILWEVIRVPRQMQHRIVRDWESWLAIYTCIIFRVSEQPLFPI
jgi:hypothetical protein